MIVCIPCGLAIRTGSRLYHGVCRRITQPCDCTHESLVEVLLRPTETVRNTDQETEGNR